MRGCAHGREENSPTDFRQPNNLRARSPTAVRPGKAPNASSSWRAFDLPRGVSILRSQGVCILTSARRKPYGPATNWQKMAAQGFGLSKPLNEWRPEKATESGAPLLLGCPAPAALTERDAAKLKPRAEAWVISVASIEATFGRPLHFP
jgi:hypothetical protein